MNLLEKKHHCDSLHKKFNDLVSIFGIESVLSSYPELIREMSVVSKDLCHQKLSIGDYKIENKDRLR